MPHAAEVLIIVHVTSAVDFLPAIVGLAILLVIILTPLTIMGNLPQETVDHIVSNLHYHDPKSTASFEKSCVW